jgi:predicted HAD superfamily Cof-like phosphohydrolase
MSIFKQQAEFMFSCGQTVGEYNEKQAELYDTLVLEEFKELNEADNMTDALKELMDCLVVLIGFGHSMGWNLDGAWEEVWKSNMSKIDKETGMVLKRADGKVLKPESYVPADVSKFV